MAWQLSPKSEQPQQPTQPKPHVPKTTATEEWERDFVTVDVKDKDSVFRYCVRHYPIARSLVFIYKKTVTWRSEFEQEMNLYTKNPSRLLHVLFSLGVIKKLILDPIEIHPYLRRRIRELWVRGVSGYNKFLQYNFFTLALKDVGGDFDHYWFGDLFTEIKEKYPELKDIIEARELEGKLTIEHNLIIEGDKTIEVE